MSSGSRGRKLLAAAMVLAAIGVMGAAKSPFAEPPRPATAPGDMGWASFNGREDGARYSSLADINQNNVQRLSEVCRVRVNGPGANESGLLVVDGVLYMTAENATLAIDPTNCDIKWKALYALEGPSVLSSNRGPAYAEGLIVRGTSDGRLLAYDAATGQERWRTAVGDPTVGEFTSSAPLIWKGKIFIGVSGGDWGIQGRVMAFDLKTGKNIWSFNTVPHAGEPGNETWAGDSWRHGGGGTWTSYTLDRETGELFVPVANPAPDFNGPAREGENLYTNSILVLDADSGHYLWHFQAIQHDTHDYGVTAPPALFTLQDGRKVVAAATKAGYLYVIDQMTHKLVYAVPTTTITNHEVVPPPEGVHVCPGIFGGTEWNGPGVDPGSQLFVVGAVDWCGTLKRGPLTYTPGELYFGGVSRQDDASSGWITGFDAATGKVRWKLRTDAPVVSGVTPTAGGLVFVGDMGGNLFAIRTRDGHPLKKIDTGGAIAGGVITYKALGTQYVAVTSGNISRATWPKATGIPSLVIYALGSASAPSASARAVKPAGALAEQLAGAGVPERGRLVFASSCSGCHGSRGEGGNGPRLIGISGKLGAAATENFIKHPKPPMPPLFPSVLTDQNVADVASYIRSLK